MTGDTGSTERPIWHNDGDIILHVNGDNIKHQFRVHSALLRFSSSVFRDMLAMPQTADTNTMLEGCPLVALDDSPKDLCALLNALYKGLAMHQGRRLDLDSALSILLLSDKYGMDDLREGIIRVIQEDWPLNRSDYLARQKLLGSPGSRLVPSAKIIRTARQCNAAELLPTAFYELATTNLRTLSAHEILVLSQMSPHDLTNLLVGRTRSEERLSRLTHAVESGGEGYAFLWNSNTNTAHVDIFHTMTGCQNGSHKICPKLSGLFPAQVGKQLLKGDSAFNTVHVLKASNFPKEVCSKCCDWLISILENKETELWDNIPVDFGLPKIDPKLYSKSMFETLC